jgi:hypothetical protein
MNMIIASTVAVLVYSWVLLQSNAQNATEDIPQRCGSCWWYATWCCWGGTAQLSTMVIWCLLCILFISHSTFVRSLYPLLTASLVPMGRVHRTLQVFRMAFQQIFTTRTQVSICRRFRWLLLLPVAMPIASPLPIWLEDLACKAIHSQRTHNVLYQMQPTLPFVHTNLLPTMSRVKEGLMKWIPTRRHKPRRPREHTSFTVEVRTKISCNHLLVCLHASIERNFWFCIFCFIRLIFCL